MADNEDQTPEGLEDFFKKVFGGDEAAEEFTNSLEDPAIELWASMYTMYKGMRAAGWPAHIANDVMSGYIFRIVTSIGESSEDE